MTQIYEDFYQAFVDDREAGIGMYTPSETGDWKKWWLIKPAVPVRPQVEALEHEFNIAYPEPFKQWFGMYYTEDMDCGIVRLPACPQEEPLRELRSYLRYGMDLLAENVVPFGYEGNDNGEMCFDFRKNQDQPAIILREHEVSLKHPAALSSPVFSSFDGMIISLTQQFRKNQRAKQ